MKKCLHLKKTKRHWRRKPPKVVTWKDRLDAEKRERQRQVLSDPFNFGRVIAMAAARGMSPLETLRALHDAERK
jgi:hypothetical protein